LSDHPGSQEEALPLGICIQTSCSAECT
jgi:hypothetical protein